MDITVVLFVLAYVAMALGHLPVFNVDRAGAAVLMAMLLIVAGRISPQAAWNSIDFETIGMLFGLMIVSAAFVEGGFYRWLARKLADMPVGPKTLTALMIVTGALLSAVLSNSIVVLAMTPVLCAMTLQRQMNPVPILLAMCFAANLGSTATLIGSPNNIILAASMHLSFVEFSKLTLIPVLLSLFFVWVVLVIYYRKSWMLTADMQAQTQMPDSNVQVNADMIDRGADPNKLHNRTETIKAAVVTVCVVAAFVFTDWPHVMIALGGGSVLLLNRSISSHDLLRHVDANLLLMLMGLFVVNEAMAMTGLLTEFVDWIHGTGVNLHSIFQSFFISAAVSDLIGNSPTIMLLSPFISNVKEGVELLGAAVALGTGFSSNSILFGSLAGIIVAEQAKARGVTIGFLEFSRTGLPITLISLGLGVLWLTLIK